ncbi:MAG: nucleotide exchange factor GrpE [Chloroflexi bacterium]|nr:nucleotide exchange factor GrpE [Chloroflexota bacterium]
MNDQNDPGAGTNGAHDPDGAAGEARPKTRAEERIEALDTSASALMEQLVEWQARAEASEAEVETIRTQWQRTAADFANYKRRTEEDRFRELGQASEALLRKVLGVADDLGRALEHVPADQAESPWAEGVAAIERKLASVLESEGVTPIEALDAMFDPRLHEAVSMAPLADVAEGTVIQELQRGYLSRDRVLRPALVVVATAPATTD